MSQMHTPTQTEQTRSAVLATSTQLKQDSTTPEFDARPRQAAQRHAYNTANASHASVQLQRHQASMENKAEPLQKMEKQESSQSLGETAQLQESDNEKPNDTGLPNQLKAGIESMSGISMDHVKVHYNSDKPAQLNAHAYAQGGDIHVAPGQEKHLPHEAWHVVQQAQGRVRPTMQMKAGVAVNDDVGLEAEADVMGAKALQLNGLIDKSWSHPNYSPLGSTPAIQRATAIHCADQLPCGNTNVWQVNHDREGVSSRAAVLALGEWNAVPAGTVCNHHWSYAGIQAAIMNYMQGPTTLNAIATNIDHIYSNLPLGAPAAAHSNRISDWQLNPAVTSTWDETCTTLNYYIYKICDYPGNLFFWPSKTGGDPDTPTNAYLAAGLPAGWAQQNPAKTDAVRLADETQRLNDAAGEIAAAMP